MIPYIQGQSSCDYAVSHLSGTMAAGLSGGSDIFHFRWTSTAKVAAIQSVTLDGLGGSATAFTAGFGNISLFIARAWTADGSGGTDRTPTGNHNQLRTLNPAVSVGAIRGSATAALTAGTYSADSQPVGLWTQTFGTATSVQYVTTPIPLFKANPACEGPIILAASEGLVVQATVPATGTWQFGITVKWQETVAGQ